MRGARVVQRPAGGAKAPIPSPGSGVGIAVSAARVAHVGERRRWGGRSGLLALRAWCDFTRVRSRADDSRTDAARCFAGAALTVLLAAGCASPIPATEVATQAHPDTATEFTLVALPDTQYYAAAHPEIFDAQTRWIAAHEADHYIAAVVHEGDIVDTDEPWQWGRAWASLHQLDDVVPYLSQHRQPRLRPDQQQQHRARLAASATTFPSRRSRAARARRGCSSAVTSRTASRSSTRPAAPG